PGRAGAGHDVHDRADADAGHDRVRDLARRVDGRDEGPQAHGPVRAHDRGHRDGQRGPHRALGTTPVTVVPSPGTLLTDSDPPRSASAARMRPMPPPSCGCRKPLPWSLTVIRRPPRPTVTAIDTVLASLWRATLSSASASTASTPLATRGGTS